MTERQKTACRLADLHFDRGLRAAHMRDLTTAARELRFCLSIRRDHPQARELLGLVYYEIGETAEALKQWILSQEILERGGNAARYIDDVQRDQARLRATENALVRYNRALTSCRAGHDDAAAVELRRALTQNPNLLAGWQLMALLELKRGRHAQAERMLRHAAKIDTGSALTQHLLQLLETERKGQEERRSSRVRVGWRKRDDDEGAIRTTRGRRSVVNNNLFNIAVGALIGILATWLIFAPARVRSVRSELNDRLVEYTNLSNEQKEQIGILQDRIEALQGEVADAEEQSAASERRAASYNGLLRTYKAYQDEDVEAAGKAILDVDPELLDENARAIYDSIKDTVLTQAYDMYTADGLFAFDGGRFEEAIPLLLAACQIRSDQYIPLNRLAHAYRYTGDYENALKYFQMIVDTFPDSEESASVEGYLEEMKNAVAAGTSAADTEKADEEEGT